MTNMTEFEVLSKIGKKLYDNAFELRQGMLALIIGLGGTGCEYAADTKKLFLERYGEEKVNKQIKFLCMDTDEETEVKYVQGKRPIDVNAEKNKNDKYEPVFVEREYIPLSKIFQRNEWIDSWLNEDIAKNPTVHFGNQANGIGGIRQGGRWVLFSNAAKIIPQLQLIFQEAVLGNVSEINVFVLASLAGGTGCSTCIDVPYFVKKAMTDARCYIPGKFFGMLELPDSKKLRHRMNNSVQIDRAWRNSYAALKELNFLMSKESEYNALINNNYYTAEKGTSIYDMCFLLSISSTDVNTTRQFVRLPGGNYLSGAIPEAINVMLSRPTNGEQGFFSRFADITAHITQIRNGNDLTARKNLFSSLGVAKVEIPLAKIILAIFNRLFIGLKARWNLLKNTRLIENVIRNEILPIFEIEKLLEYIINGILKLKEIDKEIDKGTIKVGYIGEIEKLVDGLLERADLKGLNSAFDEKITEKANEIYETYGPFFAHKVFEENDGYGTYVNEIVNGIKAKYSSDEDFDLYNAIEEYNRIPGFRCIKKSKKLDELKEKIKTYFINNGVMRALEVLIAKRKKTIKENITDQIFAPVVKMIEELSGMLNDITKIETKPETVNVGDAKIFTWDLGTVAYDDVHKKIEAIFAKKLTIEDGNKTNEIFIKGPIFKNGDNGREEVFSLPRAMNGQSYTIFTQGNNESIKNVVLVEEVLELNGVVTQTMNMEGMIKSFLENIKGSNQNDVLDLMIKDFAEIIGIFTKESFMDLLYMYSPKWDFSMKIADIQEAAKRALFSSTIEEYKKFALPSFPVHPNNAGQLLGDKERFSLRLEPRFSDEYQKLISNSRNQIIPMERPDTLIQRDKIGMMVMVNYYFEYPLSLYLELEDCKKKYYEGQASIAGMHLAEGKEKKNDWRQLDDII